MKSLVWYAAASEYDDKDPQRREAAKVRLQTRLDAAPRTEQMWFHKGQIGSAGISPKKDRFYTAATDGVVRIWNMAPGSPAIPPLVHPRGISCAAFSPDGALLA